MLALNEPTLAGIFRPRTTIAPDGSIEGYASLFGEVDQARDMMMPGAFRETLRLRGLRRIPMLFQHDPAEPIGVWFELSEDHRGLRARGKLIPDVQRAREVLALVRAGAIDGLSIGFKTSRARVDPRSRIRKISEVELWEISIVTFPLLAGARVHAVKHAHAHAVDETHGCALTDARGGRDAEPDRHERLFRRYPRVSFARARAERAWQSVARGGSETASEPRSGTHAASGSGLAARSAGTPIADLSAPRVPSAKRLEAVRARRRAPPRRERIRGWIAGSALRSAGDLKRVFVQRAQ